jgi:RND family efflux transporter MFP subunit
MPVWKQLLVCVVVAIAAAAGWVVLRHYELVGLAAVEPASARRAGADAGPGRAGRIPGMPGERGAINVITAAVLKDTDGETVAALGTAKAARSVTLFPQVSGIVSEILFKPGEAVEQGAVLVRLKDDEQTVALDRARVTLEQARETLDRSQALAKSKTITAVALSEAEVAAKLAEIELRSAEVALERQRITAPFAGTVGLTDISPGDLVSNSTEITTLEDVSTLKVTFEVPERFAGRIASDQEITANAQGMPGVSLSGRIAAMDNRVDETTRTLKLEAELANEGQALKPGMAVDVSLSFDAAEQLSVPTLSVQWDRRGSYVWKVVDGAAKRAEVTILRRRTGVVMVQGDVARGDRVVVEGIQRLREGATVAEVGAAGGEAPPALRGSAQEGSRGSTEPAAPGDSGSVRARS